MTRHAIVADNGLRYAFGHHHEFDRRLGEELAAAGVPTTLFAHREPVDLVGGEANLVPHFTRFLYEPANADPIAGFIDDYLAHNEAFARDMAHLAGMADLEDALLILPAATSRNILGLANWVATGSLPSSARLVLVLPAAVDALREDAGVNSQQVLYRHALKRLLSVSGGRARLVSLWPPQSTAYSGLADHPVATAPYPVCAGTPADGDGLPCEPMRVVYCGDPRPDKGFDLLPAIVAHVHAARPAIRFVVQVTYVPAGDQTIAQLAAAGVEIVSGFLMAADFAHLIRHGDVVLLPYQDPKYRIGTSALFAEVAYLDRPIVVPENTTMAAMMRTMALSGSIAPDAGAEALAAAILQVASDRQAHRIRATAAGAAFRAEHGMNRFVEFLLRNA